MQSKKTDMQLVNCNTTTQNENKTSLIGVYLQCKRVPTFLFSMNNTVENDFGISRGKVAT